MEKTSFMEKPFQLAKSSQQFIEELCRVGTKVSESVATITSIFSSIFDILVKAIMQEVSFNRTIYELTLTRFMFLPPYDLWMRRISQPEEEYLPPEIGRPNISFLFNVTVARKIAADLTRRLATQAPKSALFPEFAPSPEPEPTEEAIEKPIEEPAKPVFPMGARLPETRLEEKIIEEPAKSVFDIITDLQRRLESKIAQSTKGMAPALQKYGKQTFLMTPLLALPRPLLIEPTRLEGFLSQPLVTLAEKETLQVGLPERPLAEATPPMRPTQISRLLEEISPSLTSWIYGESEILRGTGVSLSAVPVAASTAQRIVTEALIQPLAAYEMPQTLGGEEPVSPTSTTPTREVGFEHPRVETFRVPAIMSSLVAAYIQRYSLLSAEPAVAETYGPPFETERVSSKESTALGEMPEEKKYSRLPAVIALAAAESLIAKRLQHEFTAFVKEMQVARSTYGETLAELGAAGPVRTTKLGELAATPVFPSTIEPYVPRAPSGPPPSARTMPVTSPIQNVVNLTVSAESTEEDLRDLERKISRILSEQISRYYGSTRI